MNPEILHLLANAAEALQRVLRHKPLINTADHTVSALDAIERAIRAEVGGK